MVCNVIQWAYVQETRQWSDEDILLSMDLDYGYYCNGDYEAPSNTRMAAETGCDAREYRFNFFVAGDISAEEEIIYNYGDFAISSGWAEFGL